VHRPACPTWRADGTLLSAMCRHLERQAAVMGDSVIVLTTSQRAAAFGTVAARYADLAAQAAFIAVFGVGMAPEPAPGVRGMDLDPEDLLAPEWDLMVLAPSTTTCSAMTAPWRWPRHGRWPPVSPVSPRARHRWNGRVRTAPCAGLRCWPSG